jgi:hypothetical protein
VACPAWGLSAASDRSQIGKRPLSLWRHDPNEAPPASAVRLALACLSSVAWPSGAVSLSLTQDLLGQPTGFGRCRIAAANGAAGRRQDFEGRGQALLRGGSPRSVLSVRLTTPSWPRLGYEPRPRRGERRLRRRPGTLSMRWHFLFVSASACLRARCRLAPARVRLSVRGCGPMLVARFGAFSGGATVA